MRKMFSNPVLWFAAAAASLILHGWWAWVAKDGTHVARCGALWAIFAAAIISRPIIRMGYKDWYASTKKIDSGSFVPSPEEIEETRQGSIDAQCVQILGPVLAILGTLLWAYGDLVANAVLRKL